MDQAQFRKLQKLLKDLYEAFDNEAVKTGLIKGLPEYEAKKDEILNKLLSNSGYSREQYNQAVTESAPKPKDKNAANFFEGYMQSFVEETVGAKFKDIEAQVEDLGKEVRKIKIPSEELIRDLALEVAQSVPPQINNYTKTEVVKETTVKEPKIIKETVTERYEYDDTNLKKIISDLSKQYDKNLETTKDELKEFFHDNFSDNFEKNVNVLDMPDFRKLAMGLQGQIDALGSGGTGSGTVGPGTVSEIAYFDSATTIKSLTTATYPSLTELSYVKGVTSAIQTQINASALASTTITIAGTASQITSSAGAQSLSANRTWTLSFPSDVLIPTVLTVPNTGLHLLDTNASHDLIIKPGSNITADRTLTLTTGDTDMIVDLTAVTDEYVLAYDTGTNTWRGVVAGSGSGDVAGPSSSTDNAIVRFDGTTGKLIQNYTSNAPTIGDTGAVTFAPADNLAALTITGGSVTGSGTTGSTILTQTWNSSGAPTGRLETYTETASSVNSIYYKILAGSAGTTNIFNIAKNGSATGAAVNIGGAPNTFNYAGGSLWITGGGPILGFMNTSGKTWGMRVDSVATSDFTLWQGTAAGAEPFLGTVRLYGAPSGGVSIGGTVDVAAGSLSVGGDLVGAGTRALYIAKASTNTNSVGYIQFSNSNNGGFGDPVAGGSRSSGTKLEFANTAYNVAIGWGGGADLWLQGYAGTGGGVSFWNSSATLLGRIDGLTGLLSTYATRTTAGQGVVAIYKAGRATAQTAANTSVSTYTIPAADGSYEVSANVLVTTSSAENFTVTVDYTDEGNTARTVTLNFQTIAAVIGTAVNFANGAVPYEGLPIHLRVKASTAITFKTTGTFTGATYNVEGIIRQLS